MALGKMSTLRARIVALSPDALFSSTELPVLVELSTLTTSTAAALQPLVSDLRSLQSKAPYLRSSGGKAFVTTEESDGIKRQLYAAVKSFRGSVEEIGVKHPRLKLRYTTLILLFQGCRVAGAACAGGGPTSHRASDSNKEPGHAG